MSLSTEGKVHNRHAYLLILILIQFFQGLIYTSIAPIFPIEAEKRNVTVTEQGLAFGTYDITALVSTPIVYLMVRSYPRPVFLVNLGLAGLTISTTAFGFLQFIWTREGFLGMAIGLRIVEGFAVTNIHITLTAIVMNLFSDNIGFVVGIMESVGVLGFVCGPPIGTSLYSVSGFGTPFWVSGGILAVVILFTWVTFGLGKGNGSTELLPSPSNLWLEVRPFLVYPTVWICFLQQVVALAVLSSIFPFLTIHLTDLYKLTVSDSGFAMLAITLTHFVGSILLSVVIRFLSKILQIIVAFGLLLIIASSLVIYTVESLTLLQLILAIVVLTFGEVVLVVIPIVTVTEPRKPADEKLSMMAVSTLTMLSNNLGGSIGPVMGGYLFQLNGLRGVALSCAIVSMATLLLSLGINVAHRRPPAAEAVSEIVVQQKDLTA